MYTAWKKLRDYRAEEEQGKLRMAEAQGVDRKSGEERNIQLQAQAKMIKSATSLSERKEILSKRAFFGSKEEEAQLKAQ